MSWRTVPSRIAPGTTTSCTDSVRTDELHRPLVTSQTPHAACALAEAAYLNRTLLFSDKFCMPAWHQLGSTNKDLWRPLEEVFNLTTTQKHGRLQLHPDPSAFVQQLTPGSSVMYLRDEILTEVHASSSTWGTPSHLLYIHTATARV